MDLYVIRRPSAWANMQELEAAGAKSAKIGNEEMADRVRWIRSYVVKEPDGRIGLEAATPEGCTPCGDPEATSSPEVEGFRVDCCACTDIALPCQSDEPQTRSKDSHGSVAAVAPVYCITAIARIGPEELPGFVPEPRPGPNLASIRTVVLRV